MLACAEEDGVAPLTRVASKTGMSRETVRKLRRSAHRSVTELETGIRKWITEWNNDPRPFTWTKSADEIPETLAGYCQQVAGPGAAR